MWSTNIEKLVKSNFNCLGMCFWSENLWDILQVILNHDFSKMLSNYGKITYTDLFLIITAPTISVECIDLSATSLKHLSELKKFNSFLVKI